MDAEAIQTSELEQEEVGSPDVDITAPEAATVEGSAGLTAELKETAGGFDVSSFKCTTCGLVHGHDTNKHRASDAFSAMSVDTAAGMEYNPNCHCGVNELARHGSDYGVDESRAASTAGSAPIPDAAAKEMDAKFGSM